jgi:hypothetical protein
MAQPDSGAFDRTGQSVADPALDDWFADYARLPPGDPILAYSTEA